MLGVPTQTHAHAYVHACVSALVYLRVSWDELITGSHARRECCLNTLMMGTGVHVDLAPIVEPTLPHGGCLAVASGGWGV